ncbi:hypothetical protein DN437_02645 [Lactobacillus reuteri]|nr:hypothetical protein [Limosilactobacillus reuteri]
MEFKSQGYTGNGQSQFSSYVISFTTQHTDSHEVGLTTGSGNQQFSGIAANIYSLQNAYYSMMSSLYGEQRALDPAGATVEAKKIIPHWGDVKPYMDKIKQDYLNNAQINVLRNKILNNITDPGALNNIVNEGNSLNNAMKNLGNSIGQYDPDGSFANHKEDTTKASDRYKYANPDKKAAYDNATEATKALINKDTGAYADQATVETLTEAENNAWSALDGVPDAEKYKPKFPAKEPVADPSHLTKDEQAKVQKNVEDANKDNFPAGTTVTVDDSGLATITYPDTSTVSMGGLVRQETDAEKYKPKFPAKEPVADPSHLTKDEQAKVQKNVEDANKDNFPAGTTVTVDDSGLATITYPDTSTVSMGGLVRQETDAEKNTPNVPANPVPVADTSNVTKDEQAKVQKNVEDANKFPAGTVVTVDDKGNATITYPDTTTDTIPGSKLVRQETDAEKNTPNVPANPVPVADTSNVTKDEQAKVQKNVEDANKFPAGTVVTVDDKGNATITYPDTTTDTIPGSKLVRQETDAEKNTPNVPGGKVTVKDPSHLTDDEKNQVKNNVDNANKDKFPEGTKVTVGDDGTTTVTYPDGSKDTIPGDQLVQGQKGDTTDAGNITPNIPGGKVTVKDPSHLTDDEKNQVKNNVDNANKDKFPEGTKVTVGDDGTTTVTYPDGSKDTIPGSDLVRQSTDADKTTPSVPGTKVPVTDPSHLTDTEKDQVKTNVTNANKDTLPSGSQVTVGNDGTTTTTYPDGSKDTIPGSDLVRQSTDADKITPKVPETKVPVTNPSQLTDSEKDQVKTNVTNANKDTLPSGSQVTVGNDGTTTTTYPDGSKDTIPGSDLVRQSTDADKTTPSVPETKVPVTDPSHLTDDEKDQVKTNVTNDNKDNLPSGSQVTVGDDGTATVTYPDGSKGTIPGRDLIIGAKGEGISGNKHDSNSSSGSNGTISNTDDETSGNTVNNAEGMNGNTAKSGSKNNSLKTLPQTGTKDVTILEILGLFLSLFGLLGLKKKHREE